MIEVFCEFRLEAAHSLPGLPASHKCRKVHGHSYRVIVRGTGPIDPATGWILDYALIDEIWNTKVFRILDHQNLNERLKTDFTTSEHLAGWIAGEMFADLDALGVKLLAVEVWETTRFGARWALDPK